MSEPGSLIRSLAGRPTARNFHSHVINEIGAGIASGRYAVGSVLPNDAEMMAHFNVSRTVLREALKTLESKGLVEARPKVGTKVSPRSRWNHFDPMVLAWLYVAGPDSKLIGQLAEIRLALETRAAAAVAQSRTADDMRLMHYWLRQMEKAAQSPLNFAIADYELHSVIADAAKNYFTKSLMGIIELAHTCAYRSHVESDTPMSPADLSRHAALLEAIEAANAKGAAAAMEKIIQAELELAHRPG